MINLIDQKTAIETFIVRGMENFTNEYGKPNSIGIYCSPVNGWVSLNFKGDSKLPESNPNCPDFEYVEFDLISFDSWSNEYNSDQPVWVDLDDFEYHYNEEHGDEGLNHVFFRYLKQIFWDVLKYNEMPETVIQLLDSRYNEVMKMTSSDRLGKYIVRNLREEPFELYRSYKLNAVNYIQASAEKLEGERLELLRNLSSSQIAVLDKLVLNLLDSSSFFLLRSLQESMDGCNGTENVSLNIDGTKANELDLSSGSLFGDYFEWLEKFSKYGKYQQ